ncbi:MAG: hypothetical protein KJI72_04220, partial [Patescibacteria group bacterium]|nr:hypothetical protein [Patescibacteria group bacterium]
MPRGRPPSAKTLVDRQLGRNVKHPVLPAGDDYQIPNLSEIRVGNEVWNFRGKVGIGTTTPIEALDVVGGNVRADKLILSRGGIGLQEPFLERTGNKDMGLFTQDIERLTISVGGNFDFKAGNLTTTGNVTADNLNVETDIKHVGDADTEIQFTPDQFNFVTGGSTRLTINNSGFNLSNGDFATGGNAITGGGAGHDQFSDFVANEHLLPAAISHDDLIAGTILSHDTTATG